MILRECEQICPRVAAQDLGWWRFPYDTFVGVFTRLFLNVTGCKAETFSTRTLNWLSDQQFKSLNINEIKDF